MRSGRLAGLLAAGLLSASAGLAQDRDRPRGEFDFYVLALSWSPGFCETRGAERGSPQCDVGRKLGFVVHGLWPQYERGYPRRCEGRNPPRAALEEAADVYPDQGLARHEWRMHGACSGLSPGAYFRSVRQARDKVAIPDPLKALVRDGQTTPQTIERAFAQVNPGLTPDMMSVTCRDGALQEVRVCMTKDLSGFRPCPEVNRATCLASPIRVTAPH